MSSVYKQIVDRLAGRERGVVGDRFHTLDSGGVQVHVDVEHAVLEANGDVEIVDVGPAAPREDD